MTRRRKIVVAAVVASLLVLATPLLWLVSWWRETGFFWLCLELPSPAQVHFRIATRRNPKDALAWHGLGLAYFQTDQWREATRALERSRTLDPTDPDLHHNLGLAYYAEKRHEEAARALEVAVKTNPKDADGYMYLGLSRSHLGHLDKARRALRAAARLAPEDAEIQYHLGSVYVQSGDHAAALKQRDLLKRLDHDYGQALDEDIRKRWHQRPG